LAQFQFQGSETTTTGAFAPAAVEKKKIKHLEEVICRIAGQRVTYQLAKSIIPYNLWNVKHFFEFFWKNF
jgi:hypothetical protein